MINIRNKKFIVTGCTGGIGNAVCKMLHANNAVIIGLNRNSSKLSNYVNEQFAADLGSVNETNILIQNIVKKYGAPDSLIHCAGSLITGSFYSLNEDQIKSVIDANLISLYNIVKAVTPVMQQNRKGHIIVTGSLGGIVPMPYSALYASMKFAVRGFCLSIAAELKDANISISLVSPGPVKTPMLDIESADDNAFISFVQKAMIPEYAARKILSVIEKPQLEKIIPAGNSLLSLLFNLYPGLFYSLVKMIKESGRKKIQKYRFSYNLNIQE